MVGRQGTPAPEPRAADGAAVRTVDDMALLLRQLRRREARRREGSELTYRQLAARAGWSHTVIAAYLTGKTLPPIDRFDTLIQLLGATAAEQRWLATARDRVEERRRAPARPPWSAGGPLVPRQLPADVPDFAGRGGDLARLDQLLETSRKASTVVTAMVTGAPGVGKTALAVHWAHQLKHRFRHGQLYADLRGFAPEPPVPPEQILDGCLVGLGVLPAEIPADPDAKAALYRSLLNGRRVLVVLDNAASPEQVRPLLPGGPDSFVIVTSRNRLTGLAARDRARRIWLDVLPPDDAVGMLTWFLGESRVAAEPRAARALARLCECLPAALCVTGERVAARPDVPLTDLVADLVAAESRLDLLDAGDDGRAAVRTMFSWSYRQLPPDAARMFRLLGASAGEVIDVDYAAASAGVEVAEAGRLLELLVAANLLRQDQPGGYALPDLVGRYAAELARAEAGGAPVAGSGRRRQAAGPAPAGPPVPRTTSRVVRPRRH